MMAGGGGRLSARAKNHAGWRLRRKDNAPRFAPLTVLFPSYSDGVQLPRGTVSAKNIWPEYKLPDTLECFVFFVNRKKYAEYITRFTQKFCRATQA